jgi:thiaminase/transcriptional activator TenA
MSTDETKPVTAQMFWDAAYPMIAVTEKHPFLMAMVDGTLAEENFKYYVVQDALYLKDFADCLQRVGDKAPTPEEKERLVEFAKGIEEAEIVLHNSFFKEWNIDAPDVTNEDAMEQMPNCLLYTSYLKRVVATESYAQGLSVLLPCFWVYMHVGNVSLKLRESLDKEGSSSKRNPAYDAWIDMYAGDEFEKEVTDYIAMVDAECKRIESDDESNRQEIFERMQQHFIMGCKLEHMFWDQASTMMKWPEIGGL